MPRDAVSRTANVGTVGINGLTDLQPPGRQAPLGTMERRHDSNLPQAYIIFYSSFNTLFLGKKKYHFLNQVHPFIKFF